VTVKHGACKALRMLVHTMAVLAGGRTECAGYFVLDHKTFEKRMQGVLAPNSQHTRYTGRKRMCNSCTMQLTQMFPLTC
jgi:hypothetical protein